jgi:hypothetical protein
LALIAPAPGFDFLILIPWCSAAVYFRGNPLARLPRHIESAASAKQRDITAQGDVILIV